MDKNVPTTEEIVEQFEGLLAANGSTTTLDVKTALRAKDFWVDQDEVSKALRDYHVSGAHDVKDPSTEITVSFNGTHRTYGLQPATADDDGSSTPSAVPVVPEPKPQAIGDWACSVYGSLDAPVTYTGMTRNMAKAQFAHAYGADYSKVRAVKA